MMKKLLRNNITGRQIHAFRVKQGLSRGNICHSMRTQGIYMSRFSLFLIEMQVAHIYDRELYTISRILHVSIDELFLRK